MKALAAVLAACATGGGGAAGAAPEPSASGTAQPATEWPMRTREHVDLWLHGFALVQSDTTQVPYFRRGYRTEVLAEKRRLNVSTIIYANADRLQARFLAYPNLVSAQFLALYFGNWDQMREAFDLFLRAEGQPQASNDPQIQQIIATFATYFPTAQDREWARIFVQGLEDASAAITAADRAPRGVLRVGAPLLVGQIFLADLVGDFLERYPDIEVELVLQMAEGEYRIAGEPTR